MIVYYNIKHKRFFAIRRDITPGISATVLSSPILAPLFLSSLAAFIGAVGLIMVAVRSDWSKKYAAVFALIASGLLLTMVIAHLAPEAIAGNEQAPLFILGGFFLGLFVHDILRVLLPVPDSKVLAAGLTPLIAIGIHSFLDGMIYTVTFTVGFDTGMLSTLGLVLHEFPEGIITFALLRGAGISNRLSFILALCAASLTTPLGTIVAIPMIRTADASLLPIFFAISAGLLLFVSTGPLMAHMRDEHPVRSVPALAFGVILALIILNYTASHVHLSDDHSTHDHSQLERFN